MCACVRRVSERPMINVVGAVVPSNLFHLWGEEFGRAWPDVRTVRWVLELKYLSNSKVLCASRGSSTSCRIKRSDGRSIGDH